MSTGKMHADEVDTDVALVRRLLGAQFPAWSGLPIVPVRSMGTVNAIYRLGAGLVVRLPRVPWGIEQLERELEWLPRLAGRLPLALPVPLAAGRPDDGYPFPWAVYQWLDGRTATPDALAAPSRAAVELAGFVSALRRIDPADAPPGKGREPLATADGPVRETIAALGRTIDTAAATAVWDDALAAPALDGPEAWVHGDLLPGNLLTAGGDLAAVIDFGSAGVGDPAYDLLPAWSLFDGASRDVFRSALAPDDAAWSRGRGYALLKGLMALPYYRESNPAFAAVARRLIDAATA